MNKAAFLRGIRDFKVKNDRDMSNEYLVKIKVDSCAICGSDIRIFNHGNKRISYPAIIGHEVSGIVVDSKKSNFKIGDKISLGADIPCGECPECRQGKPNLCKKNLAIGYQLKGGFAQYMNLNERIFNHGPVVKTGELNLELACLGEPLACSINGIEKVHMLPKGKVLIFGAGPIGIMIGFLAKKLYKADVVDFIEVNKFRRMSLDKLDISDNVLNQEELINNLDKIKESYNYVFTACSVFETHEIGIKLLSNGGAINFFGGLPVPAPKIDIVTNDLHYRELTLTGSHGSTPRQHALAIKIINENKSFFESLITHRFSLDEINSAFELASSGQGIKIIIKP